jgi:8-oxo-dGTP pyrophosphatase MutT (NUDIX family)
MHRKQILTLLDSYRQNHPEEAECVTRFLHFVKTHPDCFERSLAVGHITGSAWLVNHDGTHTLLTHHRKINQWLQLGGHADGNPNVLEVAMKEAMEESGLTEIRPVSSEIFDLDIHCIEAIGREPVHYHYDVRFALQVVGSEDYAVSHESHALRWVSIDALESVTQEKAMFRMAQKWDFFWRKSRALSS